MVIKTACCCTSLIRQPMHDMKSLNKLFANLIIAAVHWPPSQAKSFYFFFGTANPSREQHLSCSRDGLKGSLPFSTEPFLNVLNVFKQF